MEVQEVLNGVRIEENGYAAIGSKDLSDFLGFLLTLWYNTRPSNADNFNHLFLLPQLKQGGV